MKVEYNDVVDGDKLKDGELALVVECFNVDFDFIDQVVQAHGDRMIVLGHSDDYPRSEFKVRRISCVEPIERPRLEKIAACMSIGELGEVSGVDDDLLRHPQVGDVVMRGWDKITVLGESNQYTTVGVRVFPIPPGSKITL